jgi:hypothetical protein
MEAIMKASKGISLHIGLNQVDPNHYRDQFGQPWSGDLIACESDARDMQSIATEQGFSASMLLTADATVENVMNALTDASGKLGAGDILFVTYSGHGGQVRDLHNDEPDNVDETWCLFDRQVADDELYAAWGQFAAGVRILVLSDSCHSGTVTKTIERERDQLIQALEEGTLPRVRALPLGVIAGTYVAHRDTYDGVQERNASDETVDVAATVLLVSGCQDDQVSLDGAFNGAFTAALLRTWNNGAFAGDYPSFHAAIVERMPNTQRPNYFLSGAADAAFEAQRPFSIG